MKTGLHRGLVGTAVVLAALTGCVREPTEAELIASARKNLAEGKTPAAVIQIRNALEKNAQSAEARFLMAEALLANFEFAAAQDEFRRAKAAGYPDQAVVPPLARAMLFLDQAKKVIEEFGAKRFDDKLADADLSLSLAKAYGFQGDAAKSEQELKRSLQARPDYPAALLFKVRSIVLKQGVDAALEELQSHKELFTKSSEAAYLEGSLKLNGKNDVDGATEAFKRSVALDPKAIQAHGSLIAVYLYKKDMDSARKQVELLKKAHPNAPVSKTYEAELALLEGDFQKARTLTSQVLQVAPKSVRAMYIAASAELQLKNSFQAVTLLQKALALQPDLHEASKLLTRAYVQSGQAPLALKAVARALERAPADVELLSLAAEANLQMGEAQKAEALYKKALALKPEDTRTQTALALALLAKGQELEGLRQLAAISQQDASPIADMVLMSSYLARGEVDKALATVDAVERKQPSKPAGPFARGRILMLKGDNAGARAAFQEALKRDASYIPAMNNLALLDLRDGKADDARGRFQAVLKADPGNVAALMSLADVMATQNGPQAEITSLLDRAITADPSDPAPRQMLIEYLLLQKSYTAAVAAGQKAVATMNSNPELFNALGRAQSAVGESAQAQASFAKQAQLQPSATAPYMGAADAYRRAGDRANTVRSLRQALTLNPQLLAAQEILFGMELRAGRFPAALEIAKEVQRQRPTQAQGYQWEGAVHGTQRRWDEAIAVYKRGIDKLRADKRDASSLAGLLHQSLVAAKRDADATRFARDWLQSNPADLGFRLALGDAAMARQDWDGAEQQYRAVLELDANHALATNNMAAMMLRLKRPGVVEMAERAVKLAPASADALDTLMLGLAAEKQWARAAEVQRKLISLVPGAPALWRLNLAKLLLQAGDKSAAEVELKALQALGGKFDRQADVDELMKKL